MEAIERVELVGQPLHWRDTPQTLILDADDTLWQNNIYFERAIGDFIEYINHDTMTREEVRAVVDEIEHANAVSHGYGSLGLSRNLLVCYEHLVQRRLETDEVTRIVRFGESILMEEIELLEGVADSLDVLSKRHHLVMFTKGNEAEQRSKIERSGVEHHFRSTRIVPEKDRDAYRSLLSELDVDPRSTWMIGNSPKSDINPALAEGMNAVFIPHEHTWRLELQRLESGGGYFLQLAAFSELLSHF